MVDVLPNDFPDETLKYPNSDYNYPETKRFIDNIQVSTLGEKYIKNLKSALDYRIPYRLNFKHDKEVPSVDFTNISMDTTGLLEPDYNLLYGGFRINRQTDDYIVGVLDLDNNTIIRCEGDNQKVFIINPVIDYIGKTLTIRNVGENTSTTIIPFDDTVTLNPSDGNVLRRNGSTLTLVYVGDGIWDIMGELP